MYKQVLNFVQSVWKCSRTEDYDFIEVESFYRFWRVKCLEKFTPFVELFDMSFNIIQSQNYYYLIRIMKAPHLIALPDFQSWFIRIPDESIWFDLYRSFQYNLSFFIQASPVKSCNGSKFFDSSPQISTS